MTAPLTATRPGAIRVAGAAALLGTLAWSLGQLDRNNVTIDDGQSAWDLGTGGVFMLTVIGLHWAVLATRATGPRKGRIIPIGLMGTAFLAAIVNVASMPYPTYGDLPGWLMVIDPAWPLTMLGMAVEGIAIARVGKWTGPLRWLPLAAGVWLPVLIGLKFGVGDGVALTYLSALWLLGTYGFIGALLLTRPKAAIGW
ncbi:hypothetical protein [Actinorhabdospora filicis]|nr:hypothetical protein [Actinorhabdospora filicis]